MSGAARWARVLGVVGLVAVAVAMVLYAQPIPAWVAALICVFLAASDVASFVGDRLTASIARTRALTEAMKAAGDTATRLEQAGEVEQAVGALEAGRAIGELTEEAAS